MSSDSDSTASVTRVQRRRRYWRRRTAPAAWWPWGIAPLAGLVLLFLVGALFTAPRIEADVREQVAARFDDAGVSASRVITDGQRVMVDVAAPAEREAYVNALARATECDTWAGKLVCPTTVSVRLMPVEAEKAGTGAVAPASQPPLAPTLPANAEDMVGPGESGASALVEFEACNARFSDLLARSSIRFRTGSAEIERGNEELLSRLADTATSCPGKIAIEGHTDSQGDAQSNAALSLQRAQSVSDALTARGVAPDRIVAMGYGETRPIADNETREGRARNRRIEISVSGTN